MKLLVKLKNPLLKDLIEKVSILRSAEHENKYYSVLPDGMTELIINIGNSYERTSVNISQSNTVRGSHFVGVKSRYCFVKPAGVMDTLNIRFKPGAVSLFTKTEADECRDRIVDADLIFGREVKELENSFLHFSDTEDIVNKIEKFLLSKYSPESRSLDLFEQIRSVYKNSNNIFNLKAADLNIYDLSSKSLERIYKRYIGLTPKQFLNIVRFNYSSKLLYKGNLTLTDIGYKAGYFDQAHFIHSFKKLSGQSPGKYDFYSSKAHLLNQKIINSQFPV